MKRQLYNGRHLARAAAIEDLAAMARQRLPHFAWEYLASGAEDEYTQQQNRHAFERIRLLPDTLNDVSSRSLHSELWGQPLAAPVAIGPTGFNGMLWHQADISLAKAAAAHGIPFCLATLSNSRMEDVAEAIRAYPQAQLWLQLYMFRDRGCTQTLLARARAAGIRTLLLTTDAVVYGNRNWEARNYRGFKQPDLRNLLQTATCWRWLWQVYRHGLPRFANLDEFIGRQADALKAASWIESQMDTSLNWRDLGWLRQQWDGQLVLKGVMHAADAQKAVEHGVDAIVVTNHGGRQLDGTAASIEVLPAIADAVKHKTTILLDSGIRRGMDILKARRLGADAVLLGRATLFGVAAGGEAGANRALDILLHELDNGLAQLGLQNLSQLARTHISYAGKSPR
ncbi:alpha-hydroxy acid oxidase [Leeia oryzae]|uniref:alpha-hydroxy acid oxidase n=1 Tax=Leeia oryzae TaxID=356662 RepID=UPI0003795144|nr:alpha-hydroxy acid oxidase [Leeia oryzae]